LAASRRRCRPLQQRRRANLQKISSVFKPKAEGMSSTTAPLASPNGVARARSSKGQRVLTGRFAILEQLRADGLTHIFGNPGTVEQGFLDALWAFPDLQYVLTLHP
jgi:hypothetical protein